MHVETIYQVGEEEGLGKAGDLQENFVKHIVQDAKIQKRPGGYGSQWFTTAWRIENWRPRKKK